jgi:uncharacterized SAM-binding protein YcdF (DUF218 family)
MIRRTARLFTSAIALAVVTIILMGVLPVTPLLYRLMLVADPPRRADAIVVLGGGVFDEELPRHGTTARLVHGLRLYHRGYAPLVILTGGNPLEPRIPEATVMRRVAEELGVKPDVLVVETSADRTGTQGDAVARIARVRGIRSILLVTSPEHSFRAARVFRKTGLDVISAPVVGRRPPRLSVQIHPLRVLDRTLGLIPWIYEGVGIALYWWRGWL